MNVTQFIAALKKFIPFLRIAAKWTPTLIDDQAVDWLEKFFNDPTSMQAAVQRIPLPPKKP